MRSYVWLIVLSLLVGEPGQSGGSRPGADRWFVEPPTHVTISSESGEHRYLLVHPRLDPIDLRYEHMWDVFYGPGTAFEVRLVESETSRYVPGYRILRVQEGSPPVQYAVLVDGKDSAYLFGNDEDVEVFAELLRRGGVKIRGAVEAEEVARLFLSLEGFRYHNHILERAGDLLRMPFVVKDPLPSPEFEAELRKIATNMGELVRPPWVEERSGRYIVRFYTWSYWASELSIVAVSFRPDGTIGIRRQVVATPR